MRELFKDFGTVDYNGFVLTDISKRVIIEDIVKDNPEFYFEYDIEGFERPEHLAQDFYNDVKYTWLIFLMNDVIDPIYDWILPENMLKTFITDKYGAGNETAIKYYLNADRDVVFEAGPGTTPVTNTEYEERINESKRKIRIIRAEYVQATMDQLRTAL